MSLPPADGWALERVDGIGVLRCAALAALPGVAHGFSTRLGDGDGPFDVGREDSTDPVRLERRRRLLAAAGLAGRPVVLHQVHGARVATLDEAAAAGGPLRADGLWGPLERTASLVPLVRTADCVPLLLASTEAPYAVAAVHAGWRGTAAGIAAEAVARMGGAPSALVAALGPSIGPCCYEVAPDVAARVAAAGGVPPGEVTTAGRADRPHLDLPGANRLQLEAAGLEPGRIHAAPWCTACRPDVFFSYRAEGGPTGSLAACVGLAAVA